MDELGNDDVTAPARGAGPWLPCWRSRRPSRPWPGLAVQVEAATCHLHLDGHLLQGDVARWHPVLNRCSAALAFAWGDGSPAAAVPVNQFSARYARTATFAAGSYTFTAQADDGVKVDAATVLDAWTGARATSRSATAGLSAGMHTVVVEYYQTTGTASPSALYAKAGAPAKTNLVSNGDLSTDNPVPTCFFDGGWGERASTAALSADVPAGATDRSWRIDQSAYVSGDAKLVPADAPGCVGDLDPGRPTRWASRTGRPCRRTRCRCSPTARPAGRTGPP